MRRTTLLPLALLLFASSRPVAAQEPAPPPRLVVVAPAAWERELAPYLELRRRELTVELAPLEDALAGEEGRDAPERLKRFLYRAWRERGARYALLVGDCDTLPVRYMVLDRWTEPAFHVAFYPSDLYYADLAHPDGRFDDWNGHTAGRSARYWGQVQGESVKRPPINLDGISYLPELAVGRWPVSTAGELVAVVQKTIAWEARARAPAGERRRRSLWLHAGGWVDARGALTAWSDGLAGAGWSVSRQLFGGEGEAAGLPAPPAVLAALRGGVELVAHAGHGSPSAWDACLGPAEVQALLGPGQPAPTAIYFSVGCSTAQFATLPPYEGYLDEDGQVQRGTNAGQRFTEPPPPPASLQPGRFNTTGLGEALLRAPGGGAVAYLGCNTGSQPCALTLLEGFTAALARRPAAGEPPPRLGDAWREAVRHYWERERLSELVPTDSWYPPSVFFQGMKFMLFGDPSLPLP